jgi:hypothetical protein
LRQLFDSLKHLTFFYSAAAALKEHKKGRMGCVLIRPEVPAFFKLTLLPQICPQARRRWGRYREVSGLHGHNRRFCNAIFSFQFSLL